MNKIKGFLISIAVVLLMPLTVFAENEKINVYIFRGEGCGFCASALAFFESLDEEYKSYFNLVEYEVWYDSANAEKMQEVASYFNESVQGVPYIIIGDKTFQGFTESYQEDIKTAIKNGYENTDGNYQDRVAPIMEGKTSEKDKDNTAITIIILIVAVAGIGFLVYIAREDTTEKEENTKSDEKPKQESKTSSLRKTTTKKATSNNTTKKKTASKK